VMNIAHGLDLGSARGRSSGPAARAPHVVAVLPSG
jgi:hypothetical protein